MDYNLSGGGEHFIRISQAVCKHLMGEDQLTSETIRQVYLLGWAIEMVGCFFLAVKPFTFFLIYSPENNSCYTFIFRTDGYVITYERRYA